MIKDSYDVAIVGAGPAGAIFAKELAYKAPGLSVLLVDGQDESNKKVCGGLLAPDAQRMFAKFDMTLPTSVLCDPQIFDVETIDLDRGLVRYYQRHYLNMDRYEFDKWLISLIPHNVDVYNGRCSRLCRDGDRVLLMLGDRKISARRLVGADGAGSLVRKTFFNDSVRKYIAIQQRFKCTDVFAPPYSCIFDAQTSDSCSWTIRKDGYIIFGGAFDKKGCRQAFEKQKMRVEQFVGASFGKAIETQACLLTSPRKMKHFKIGEGNVFLVGEAAGFISASSFEGISSAMLSARLLAEAFVGADNDKRILSAYRKSTRKLRLRLYMKIQKCRVLCSPFLRGSIMKSGIQSIEKYK